MKNFLKIGEGQAMTLALLQEIHRQPDLWDENKLRTTTPGSPHSEVSDIWLFFNKTLQDATQEELFRKIVNDREVVPYRAWPRLPSARPLIFGLMRQVEAVRLGRVIITKLMPGGKIAPHVDGGAPATFYTRYQIALQCLPGNMFRIDNEQVEMCSGDIWMIDNKKEHEVINNSVDDRIVMIVDLRSE